MTGTGTKDDPFIVDNWEDYISINSTSKYVEFDQNSTNKIIDFNEIQPEGFSKILYFPVTNFNGWTFRNFHSTASTAIRIGMGTYENLIFENFYFCPENTSNAYLFSSYGNGSKYFCNVVISGQIQSVSTTTKFIDGCDFCESSANIVVNSTGKFRSIYNGDIKNSEIVVDISAENVDLCNNPIINSRISGKIQSDGTITAGSTKSAYNVFNIQSNQPIDYQGQGISVYNSDISQSVQSENFLGCTDEQLRNAQYLYDLRFPIGVD
ncbi:MAG: hypothetical protein K2I06_14215 [Ruminococcus sp.]|nr:hypothetical protein [Ruminococcus sp.]